MLRRILVFLILLFSCITAESAENQALGKSYAFTPSPSYPLCTDEADTTQLTDGKALGSQWTQKSTVGWRKAEPVVEVVIDLGQKIAVEQVFIHTIGGGFASVEFPEYAAVLLSDNGTEFGFAGLVSSEELNDVRATGYTGVAATLSIAKINAAGRYVKLVIRPTGLTLFIDEIEVVGEPLTASNNSRLRSELEIFQGYDELLVRIEDYLQLKKEISATGRLAKQIDLPEDKLPTSKQLLESKRRLGETRAGIYKEFYKKEFVAIPAEPMEIVYEKDLFLRDSAEQIEVQMWRNEYESAAFNIINCSEQAMTLRISVSPLLGPNQQRIESDGTFAVRRAVYVQAARLGSIADALVLQQDRSFELQPGELSQIWLTIFNPDLEAGKYRVAIAVLAETQDGRQVPMETIDLNLTVQENLFPENVALKTCNWAYYKIAPESETAEDLRSHHTNVYVVAAQDLPFLRFSSDPVGMVRQPDYSKLDNLIQAYNYAQTFTLGLNFNVTSKDFGRFGSLEWMTPEWKKVFSSWLQELVAHLKTLGIGYDRFVLYPFDESIADEYYELAQLIKSIDPNIRLYANSFGEGPSEFMRFRELIDVWCLQDSHCIKYPEWFDTIKGFGKELWTYECLRPMKAKEPYFYYRLLPWRAFKRGQTGAGFWTYYYGLGYDTGTVPWDDTLRPYGFSGVVYGAKAKSPQPLYENIIPSRRWESWRNGVEDYQYLYELQQEIGRIRIVNPQLAQEKQQILDQQVDRVLNNSDDISIVNKAKAILSQALLELRSISN